MLGRAFMINPSSSSEPMQDQTDPRTIRRVAIDQSFIKIDVMIYRQQISDLTPLVIVNSIELPMPPSQGFCDRMWQAGYQVIFIRRPGFGGAPGLPSALMADREVQNGAAAIAEAALLQRLLETLGLKDVVLLGLGTGNSVCVRLSKLSATVQYSIFSNPLFHQSVWDIVRPTWVQSMVRQLLLSKGGLSFTVQGLKSVLKRRPAWFYRQFAQKSAGDLDYVAENMPDFEAAASLMQNMASETVYYDLQMALVIDTDVDHSFLRGVDGIILCGTETTEDWKRQIKTQSERLAFPIVFAPSGDLFVPYKSPDILLEILNAAARRAAAPG